MACKTTCQAIVDSGTTLVVGPKDEIDEINLIAGAQDIGDEIYGFPCNQSLSELPGKTSKYLDFEYFCCCYFNI